jgi:peptidoglycan L-alanyl-D-glutamate endopeptidase CwlK
MARTIDNWRAPTLDARSERNLQGVHADLVRVIRAAHAATAGRADGLSFIVIEGLRTQKRQAELVAAGASRTMQGRHLTGHAVDLMATVAGKGRWDWPLYATLGALVKSEAVAQGVPLVWGGDWRTLRDGPHFELDRKAYP